MESSAAVREGFNGCGVSNGCGNPEAVECLTCSRDGLSREALLSPEILRGRLVFNDNCRALGGRGVGGPSGL
jgi:hypothetical protein